MKSGILITACAALLLGASPAQAVTLDFSGHDNNNNGENSHGNHEQDHWENGNDGDHGKSGGYSSRDDSSWEDKDSWSGGDSSGGDKDKFKKNHVPPPLCATADPDHDHDGKWDDHGDDGKFGRRFVKYYHDLCDKEKGGDPGHHKQGCDPDPTPLPGALSMFGAGLLLLFGFSRYKKTGPFTK